MKSKLYLLLISLILILNIRTMELEPEISNDATESRETTNNRDVGPREVINKSVFDELDRIGNLPPELNEIIAQYAFDKNVIEAFGDNIFDNYSLVELKKVENDNLIAQLRNNKDNFQTIKAEFAVKQPREKSVFQEADDNDNKVTFLIKLKSHQLIFVNEINFDFFHKDAINYNLGGVEKKGNILIGSFDMSKDLKYFRLNVLVQKSRRAGRNHVKIYNQALGTIYFENPNPNKNYLDCIGVRNGLAAAREFESQMQEVVDATERSA